MVYAYYNALGDEVTTTACYDMDNIKSSCESCV